MAVYLGSNKVAGVNGNGSQASTSNKYSYEETKTNMVWMDGKPIYRRTYSFGALPNANVATHVTDFAPTDVTICRCYGTATNGTGTTYPLPYVHPTNLAKCISLYCEASDNGAGNLGMSIRTGEDRSAYTGIVHIEYTKVADTTG